jgi:hypothetical protein
MRQDDPTELLARLVAAGARPLAPASLQKPSLPK